MKMGDGYDFLRSLIRGFAEGAGHRLGVPFRNVQKLLRDTIAQASSVPERQIAKALTRVSSVREASVVCREDSVRIEATFEEGDAVSLSVIPTAARFAPRGAKELSFRVEPAELAGRLEVRDMVGAIAALVAHTLWAPFFGRLLNPSYDAIAERDRDEVRVDLRSVQAVRTAHQKGLGQLFDLIELSGLSVIDGAIRLHVKLPPILLP